MTSADDLVAKAAAAARAAVEHPAGTFDSAPLDALLARAAKGLPRPRRRRPSQVRTVCHIATGLYDIGGHTRLVTRWIGNDAGRRHLVVLTGQRGSVPAPVRAAVDATGGYVVRLDRDAPPLARAAALREHLQNAEVAVLHAHPDDVIPPLALAAWRHRPAAVVANHADHAFWPGASLVDVVADIRPGGAAITLTRRGVPPRREVVLPIPLDPPASAPSRAAARAALGWPASERVLLSMASAFKYACLPGPRLPDLLGPARDGARLVVIGPEPGLWPGVETVGVVPDPALHLAAADVYVDSFPAGSLTASLDAATAGLPVVAYQPEPEGAVLYSDDECLAPGAHRTVEAFRAAVLDPPPVADLTAHHTGAGWRAALERCYARALDRPTGTAPVGPPTRLDDLLAEVAARRRA